MTRRCARSIPSAGAATLSPETAIIVVPAASPRDEWGVASTAQRYASGAGLTDLYKSASAMRTLTRGPSPPAPSPVGRGGIDFYLFFPCGAEGQLTRGPSSLASFPVKREEIVFYFPCGVEVRACFVLTLGP